MKKEQKESAITLRHKGVSMGEISRRLGVAKSTVSYWVRDIQLSESHTLKLQQNSHSRLAIERRRTSRMANSKFEREKIFSQAYESAATHKSSPLWCVAVSLYWGEGGKTQRTVRISNSDPAVIILMMKFFREFCDAPLEKFRGHVHAFAHSDEKAAVAYWSKVSGIPQTQFFKTYIKNSSASKKIRTTLPYGTCQIYVHDSVLFIKMMAWIEFLKNTQNYD